MTTEQYIKSVLDRVSDTIRDMTESTVMRALHAVNMEAGHPAFEDVDAEALDFAREVADQIIYEYHTQLRKDARRGQERLRAIGLQVSSILATSSQRPDEALMVAKRYVQPLRHFYMDSSGRKWKSERYIHTMVRTYLQTLFNEVYLLDWGTAKVWGSMDDQTVTRYDASKLKEAEEQQLQTLTGGGQRPGTPLYMSPEQIQGNRSIDERSDVFNVGVCMYELLAIREPFRGANIDQTFRNIISADVPPPSEKAPDRNIPKSADEVVMRAIKKKPAERYQTMREMLDAIVHVIPQLDQG